VAAMSFNIRLGTVDDGPNHWNLRRQMVVDLIARRGTDVVGLQEAVGFQVEQILGALDGYDGVLAGEHCTILYRRDRFLGADSGTFWFSNTPEVPRSMHWGNRHARICTWVRLIERKTGRGLYVYNVHLDHQSQEARLKSTRLLARRMAQRAYKAPVVVMGDFNMPVDNPGMQFLVAEGSPVRLTDSWRKAHPDKPETRTFNGFKGLTDGVRIDFILVDPETAVMAADIDRTNEDGRYPSDHYPITATLKPW
jgi:endonuclease/exonuclease/phosphatase family metal-dependent hydrolase